ncbi:MAG: glycosyltransferase family 9 protein [Gammaproteobacteria bacterium]|nr:glycosyltransferase family 9 protein [Gammaproteobacteria bacterium]
MSELPRPSYPPKTLCLLRLSAIGDVSHMLPVVHTLRHCWPDTQLTWIIGETEVAMVERLEGIEFVVFRKSRGLQAYRDLTRILENRRFDGLFLMQIALRAGLASLCVRSPVRLGFDPGRARYGHSLFVNHRIAPDTCPHVIDGFMGFLKASGIEPDRFQYRWDVPEDPLARAWAEEQLPDGSPIVVISPCAGNPERNWRIDRYARVADHLAEAHGMRVVVTCSKELEQVKFTNELCARMQYPPINMAGRTNLQQLLAVLRRARFMIGPDSGPIHLAAVADIPALGLCANSNPRRTGPYRSLDWCVDRYDDAAIYRFGQKASNLRWGHKIHDADVMGLITVEEVIRMAEALLAELDTGED